MIHRLLSQNLICIKRVRNKHFLQPHLYLGDGGGGGGAGQEMGKIPMLPKSDLFLSHFLSHLTKVKARLNLGSLTECQEQNRLMSFGCIERFHKSPSFPSKMYPPRGFSEQQSGAAYLLWLCQLLCPRVTWDTGHLP